MMAWKNWINNITRNLILILGDQLNVDSPALEGFDAAQDRILMVEAAAEATQVWSHKARIVLFLSAMRHFMLALQANIHAAYSAYI